jgi:Putative zinc-finger
MNKRECRWVRALLPLWVGDGGPEECEASSEEGDLSGQDRERVERHLVGCPSCREQQKALGRAFSALVAAKAEPPVDRAAPSLWPLLERRINGQQLSERPGRSRPAFGMSDRLSDLLTALDRARLGVGSFVVYAAVASLLVSLVMGTIARRQRIDAQATIEGNTTPLAESLAPATFNDAPSKLADLDDDSDSTANQLAEVDPVVVPETSTSGVGSLPAKPAVHGRFGQDLDRGAAGAGDTRESKPIY